jgi:hypothetical protein
MEFNDACTGFDELRTVIVKARELAAHDQQLPPPIRRTRPRRKSAATAAERAVTPRTEQRRAPIATARDLEMEQAAAARKRRLLVELEQERLARIAAGDTREIYILCPERAVAPRTGERPAAIATAYDLETEQAATARKRRLLAELEQERLARIAVGDTRETYILCPERPSNWWVSKVSAAPGDPAKTAHNPENLRELVEGLTHTCGGLAKRSRQ